MFVIMAYGREEGFSTSAQLTLWAGWFFVIGNSCVYGKLFSSILDLCQLKASTVLFSTTASPHIPKCLQTLPNIPHQERLPPTKNHWFQIQSKGINVSKTIFINKREGR